MSKSDTLKELQEIWYCLKEDSGAWRKEPTSYIDIANTSKHNINIIKDILNLVIDSDEISMETKMFIKHRGMTIKEINSRYNDMIVSDMKLSRKGAKRVTYQTTILRMRHDDELISTYFSTNMLTSLIYNEDTSEYNVEQMIKIFSDRAGCCEASARNLMINIDKSKIARIDEYVQDSSEFFEVLDMLLPYVKQRRFLIEQAINNMDEFVSYFNYLLSKEALSDIEVQSDKNRLMRFLNNEDYSNQEDEENEMDNKNGNGSIGEDAGGIVDKSVGAVDEDASASVGYSEDADSIEEELIGVVSDW